MTDDLFNTATDEANRLITELSETKEALRALSGKLTRIETRLKRVFPQAFAKRAAEKSSERQPSGTEASTLTPETALRLYEELVEHARNDQVEAVREKLSALSLPDLSFLWRELGASLGKRKPSAKVLIEVILGRVRESVMLSKHTNRKQLVEQSESPKDSPKENKED